MSQASDTVFLFDVDNTLLDNDQVIADLKTHLTAVFGEASQHQYWRLFEALRVELGYADYLGTLQRFRAENLHDPQFLKVALYLLNYPFATRLLPGAMDTVAHAGRLGLPVILSDGDVVFQPHKVCRSGLLEAFKDRVLIYIHKEAELDDVEAKYPAGHYVLIDDKLRILTAVKSLWGSRVTTVFVRQGHYAHDAKVLSGLPQADVTLERVHDLLHYDLATLKAAALPKAAGGEPHVTQHW